MKEKKKVKGGKRAGSGRKPSGRQKEAVTVYTDVSRFGGKAGARMAIYEFLDGKITDTGKKAFIPLDEKKALPSDRKIKHKAPKEGKGPIVADLTKPTSVLKPQEQPKTNFSINTAPDQRAAPVDVLRNMDIEEKIQAIKSEKCPKERDTTLGKKSWELEQRKRIQGLENQLK